MNKNYKKIAAAGILAGCLTIGSVGGIALANGNAYENYKDAVIKTVHTENMTLSGSVSVKLDDEVVAQGDFLTQKDEDDNYLSGELTAAGESAQFEQMSDGNSTLIHRDNEYYSIVYKGKEGKKLDTTEGSENTVRIMEIITDTLVGDMKNQFTGSKGKITANLEGAQIPELLQLAVSAMAEQDEHGRNKVTADMGTHMEVFQEMDILKKDIKVEKISLTADVSDGVFTNHDITVSVSGKDADGKSHKIDIQFQAEITEIGTTVVNSIDTEGKEVKKLEESDFGTYSHGDR